MKVMQPSNMMPSLVASTALLLLFSISGSTAECGLDITSSILRGKPIFGDKLGPYDIGGELVLTCSTSGDACGPFSWWDEADRLLSEGPKLTLQLGPCDDKRRLQCRAGEVNKTIQLEIQVPLENPCVTSTPKPTTSSTVITKKTTTKAITTTEVSPVTETSSPTESASQMNTTISIPTPVQTSIPTPVQTSIPTPVQTSIPTPVQTSIPQQDINPYTSLKLTGGIQRYLMLGGVTVVGVLALIALAGTVILYRKVRKVGSPSKNKTRSTNTQRSSTQSSSVENSQEITVSLTSLDSNDLPPVSPLTVNTPQGRGAYDPLLTSGEAVVAADNMDHSYYYPEQPCSYHYLDITQKVREQILRDLV